MEEASNQTSTQAQREQQAQREPQDQQTNRAQQAQKTSKHGVSLGKPRILIRNSIQ